MKAYIYARVSSTTDRQSTDRQVNSLTDIASAMGYEVAGIYREHISGATINKERAVIQGFIFNDMYEWDRYDYVQRT